MAESERKHAIVDGTAKTDSPTAATEDEITVEEAKNSSMKQSWSGWFQKVNDAVLAMGSTKEEENKVESKEEGGSAETEDKGPTWGSWGTSLLQQAKEKTLTTLELVKKDLTEFSDVVQNETAHIVSATATTIRDRAPHLVDSIVGTVNTVLSVEDTTRGEEQDEIPITAATAAAVCASRSQTSSSEFFLFELARLYAIQSDPETYCNEPDGAPELFDDWLDHHFKLEDKKEEISHLLGTNPAVRNMFAQLVPSQVSNTTFWQRYFYKLHKFELDEARRRALFQREEAVAFNTNNPHLSWGDESDHEDHRDQADNVETESFCDLAKDVATDDQLAQDELELTPTAARGSPLCGREPPKGVSAIPKSWDGERHDPFNVEMKEADDGQDQQQPEVQPLETDLCSVSSFGTLPRNDGESSSSPTDKKSDDWVEWEGNDNGN